MKLFLDSSVLLAASGSAKGASRLLIVEAVDRGLELVSSLCGIELGQRILKSTLSLFQFEYRRAVAIN